MISVLEPKTKDEKKIVPVKKIAVCLDDLTEFSKNVPGLAPGVIPKSVKRFALLPHLNGSGIVLAAELSFLGVKDFTMMIDLDIVDATAQQFNELERYELMFGLFGYEVKWHGDSDD